MHCSSIAARKARRVKKLMELARYKKVSRETYHLILPRETTHRFVPFELAMDYVRAGWLPMPTLAGCRHGEWRVHMIWICQCSPPLPERAKHHETVAA